VSDTGPRHPGQLPEADFLNAMPHVPGQEGRGVGTGLGLVFLPVSHRGPIMDRYGLNQVRGEGVSFHFTVLR